MDYPSIIGGFMKKFLCLFSCLFLALTLFASCKTQSSLSLNVSELRTNCYESIDSITKIKATYGYIESQRDLDGVAGQKIYLLQFRLVGKELDNTTYDLQLNHNQQRQLKLNRLKGNGLE